MTISQQTEHKYLINCGHGANDIERATIAFVLAVTASKTCETAVFATADAAGICVRGGAAGLLAEGYEPLAELMAAYRSNGGKIWLCPACAKAKGISQADLADGVEIAGAPRTMAFLGDGAQLLA
jgi:predicted peroxiredoxin